jgi:hypothetical protein
MARGDIWRGGHSEGGRSCHGTRGGQRVATHPLNGLPSMPCSRLPAHRVPRAVRGVLCFFCSFLRVFPTRVVTLTPLTPSEWRVGRTARMTMSFGYVADGRCCFRFATCHARAPLGWWRARGHPLWSSHVEMSFLFAPLPLPLGWDHAPHRAHAPQEGHCFDPALNERATTNV